MPLLDAGSGCPYRRPGSQKDKPMVGSDQARSGSVPRGPGLMAQPICAPATANASRLPSTVDLGYRRAPVWAVSPHGMQPLIADTPCAQPGGSRPPRHSGAFADTRSIAPPD